MGLFLFSNPSESLAIGYWLLAGGFSLVAILGLTHLPDKPKLAEVASTNTTIQ